MKNLLLIVSMLALMAGTAGSQAKLVIDQPEHDFGRVPPRSVIGHRLWLKSCGDEALIVREIKTGCGCITVSPPSAPIDPGDSLSVTVYWDTRASHNRLSKNVYLFTNAGQEPYRVRLTADCSQPERNSEPPVAISPSTLTLPPPKGAKTTEGAFFIISHVDKPLAASVVSNSIANMDIILPENIPPDSTVRGRIVLPAADWFLELAGSITLELEGNGAAASRYTIPITGGNSRIERLLTKRQE